MTALLSDGMHKSHATWLPWQHHLRTHFSTFPGMVRCLHWEHCTSERELIHHVMQEEQEKWELCTALFLAY